MLLLGRPAVFGVLFGAFAANATAGEPSWVAAGIAIGNTLEAVTGAAILKRFGFDAALQRLRDVLGLFAAVAAAPVVSATVGVTFLVISGLHAASAAPALWLVWWLGDALGGLIVAPLILVWTRHDRLWRARGFFEPAAMLLGVIAISAFIFGLPPNFPLAYAVYPFLIWAALRLGPAYTTTASLLANAVAVIGTLSGRGPFAGFGPERGLVLVQIFMALGASTALILGAIAAQSRRAHEELRIQHRHKDEFLAMLGHELRNPLAAIVHAIDLAGSNETSEREQAQRVIRRQAHSLSRLVDDLLDVSRITRGQISLERKPFALAGAVNSGVDVWRHLVTQKRQQLTIDVPSTMWIRGDAMRFAQVVANLVHNAAKFTPEGNAIAITAAEESGTAVLRVYDDGRGMTPDILAHAFELFVQGPPALDRQHGGLGLGLTLVHRLVEMHGGTVEARSEGIECGTEIILRLPLVAAPEREATPVEPPRAAPSQPRRVLVVEDNADARDMLVYLLRRNGHDVRGAGDGPAAIAEAQSFAPQIVLLDLGLPGMDGYTVARELRASPHTAGALIVALTGYGQPDDRERAFAAGFDDHLLKPTDPKQVLEVIQRERTAS